MLVEEMLSRELNDVAESLHVPAMPALPERPQRPQPHWLPLLAVAASVVLIVAGTVLVGLNLRGDRSPQPTPEPTTPTQVPPAELTRTPPTVPYVLNGRL